MLEPLTPSLDEKARPALLVQRTYHEPASRLAVEMSHEFRTPLNIILISAQMLRIHNQQISEEKRLIYLQRIEDAVTQMTTLLDKLLATEAR
jgi:signal transduction histidine kinase